MNISMIATSAILALGVPPMITLACAVVLCYMVARVAAEKAEAHRVALEQRQRRAKGLAKELHRITEVLRQDLNSHRDNIDRFKGHLASATKDNSESPSPKMKGVHESSQRRSLHSK